MSISLIEKEDINKIHDLEIENFSSDAWTKNMIEESFSSLNDYIFKYTDEGNNLIGYAIIRINLDEAELFKICINKTYRNKHLASKLLGYIENFCKQKEVKKIFLEVRSKNEEALNLYTKHKFTQISKRNNYYKEPDDSALIMQKTL